MAIDLSRFIATFFDEAQEHLESIEGHAMALGGGRDDAETLNSIFRAAHSIKGGAGTFGFTQLAEVTHELETLFDGLRKGTGTADETTVRMLLDACDVFGSHLARLKSGDRGHDPAMDRLLARMHSGAGGGQKAAAPAPARAEPTEEAFFATAEAPAPAPAAAGSAYGLFEPAVAEERAARNDMAEERAARSDMAEERAGKDQATAAAPENRAAGEGEKFGFFDPTQGGDAGDHNRRRGDSSSIRVSTEKIDRIVNLVGELVIAQAMMQQSVGRMAGDGDERVSHSLATLDRNTRELQQAVMSIRMMPVEFVFSRFPRLVYDVSTKLGKQVRLRTQGQETELDKELIELLVDPLTHVVRNAIDHGIETPDERRRAAKDETGTVMMRATHRGGSVIIEVSDDGRGLDRDRILAKARELDMPVSESMTEREVWDLIFEPGFSTAKEVTSVSGRGVGMDVVRRNITSLGGSVSVQSRRGEGTTITIQLPLTLAVLDGMIVGVGSEQYIVPLEFVAEAFMPKPGDIRTLVNQPSLVAVRGEQLPLVRLEDVVELPAREGAPLEPLCLVVEVDNRRAALLVDALVGQQQLVVKSLETNLHAVPGVAGATILGDGRVSLILDVSAVTRTTASRGHARSAA